MITTCGAGFKSKEVSFGYYGQKMKMKLNLWDTAGQEKYDALTKFYFKGAEAALVVYDMTDEKSFAKAQKWVKDLEQVKESDQVNVLTFLVGNKCDMSAENQVSTMQGQEYAKEIGAQHFEVSAKEDIGINSLFEEIAKQLQLSC